MVMVAVPAFIPINTPQDGPGSPSGCEDRGDPAPELRASFLPRTLSLRNSISKSESRTRWGLEMGGSQGLAGASLTEPTSLCL